jgi:hypothetical protein
MADIVAHDLAALFPVSAETIARIRNVEATAGTARE